MITKTPIKCKSCGTIVGYDETFRHMVLFNDVVCPRCGMVVIQATGILCNTHKEDYDRIN